MVLSFQNLVFSDKTKGATEAPLFSLRFPAPPAVGVSVFGVIFGYFSAYTRRFYGLSIYLPLRDKNTL